MNNSAPFRYCPGSKVGLISFRGNILAAFILKTGRCSQTCNFVTTIVYATLSKEAQNVKKLV